MNKTYARVNPKTLKRMISGSVYLRGEYSNEATFTEMERKSTAYFSI